MGGTQSEEIVAEMLAQRNEVARAPQWGRPRLSHARAGRAGGGAGPEQTFTMHGIKPARSFGKNTSFSQPIYEYQKGQEKD